MRLLLGVLLMDVFNFFLCIFWKSFFMVLYILGFFGGVFSFFVVIFCKLLIGRVKVVLIFFSGCDFILYWFMLEGLGVLDFCNILVGILFFEGVFLVEIVFVVDFIYVLVLFNIIWELEFFFLICKIFFFLFVLWF